MFRFNTAAVTADTVGMAFSAGRRRRALTCLVAMAAMFGALLVAEPGQAGHGSTGTAGTDPLFGRIAGIVRGNGAHLAAIRVAAFAALQGPWDWPVAETLTDSRGLYVLSGLSAGTYRVMADGSTYSLPVRFWPAATRFSRATPVVVRPARTTTRIGFDLSNQPDFPPRPSGHLRVPRVPAGLAGVPVDPLEGYQGQTSCRPKPRRGTRALVRLLFTTYGSQEGAGLNRTCAAGTSEHYDGRAIDWSVTSRVPDQARKGDSFTRWLTRSRGRDVGVMSRRLGVMYVIWRGRIWKQYQAAEGWQVYEHCNRPKYLTIGWDSFCHRNHVHISLTDRGARMGTSWWRASAAT